MHQMTVEYLGDLETQGMHLSSGSVIRTDAPKDNNGKGSTYSPTDLVSSALASCMLTIMGIVARRDNIPLEGTTIQIEKVMSVEAPRRIAALRLDIKHPDPSALSGKEAEILKRSARTCPVALSLHPDIEQDFIFNF
ncbi:MAG: OsmC family protein [Cytophagaceae bacterium]|jgi:uncharacterized OsmC-like protein|nr:OsmC family protein [Cytophagaceae bacterium]